MFDSELLRSFVTVAETGSFTHAAELLNSTQSTVSAQIRRLEVQVGKPVFARSTRHVTLAPAGEILLGYARTILHLNEDARARLAGGQHTGTLRIGIAEDLSGAWLTGALRRFRARHPAVRLDVAIGLGPALFQQLDDRRLDLVAGGRCHGDNQGSLLWREPLIWAFAERTPLPDPLPLALFPEPCPYREAALRALAEKTRDWIIACTSGSVAGVRATALAGVAVTPLPQSLADAGLRILGAETGLPPLPEVEYVIRIRPEERRGSVLAMADLMRLLPRS